MLSLAVKYEVSNHDSSQGCGVVAIVVFELNTIVYWYLIWNHRVKTVSREK